MELHTFDAINSQGECAKTFKVCASSESGARALAVEKLKFRFPQTWSSYELRHTGRYPSIATYTNDLRQF